MTLRPVVLWRSVAATLWIISLVIFLKAVGDGITAEESLYNPRLSASDRISIQHLAAVADRWAAVGWVIQVAAAGALSLGIRSERVARRIFVSLGILIAADGVLLLIMAVIVR